jgi:hypothetical protein
MLENAPGISRRSRLLAATNCDALKYLPIVRIKAATTY